MIIIFLNVGSSFVNATYNFSGKNITARTIVKYGGFGACAQKVVQYFTKPDPAVPVFPQVPLAEPSWVTAASRTPGVLNPFFVLYPGVYKFDVTYGDVKLMNQAATLCLDTCRKQNNTIPNSCQIATYGYEDGVWFCKLWKKATCNNVDIVWGPAPAMVAINSTSEIPPTFAWKNGCRISDLIPTNTPTLPGKPMVIDPNTPFATVVPAPYNPDIHRNLTELYGSIRCVADVGFRDIGLSPGWPTYGTVWL